MKKLLFVGSVMADIVCPVDHFPQPGQGVVAEGYSQALGGCAFNAANAARQKGADCFLLAPIGAGTYADFLRNELAKRGLNALEVGGPHDCGAAVCLVQPDGERTMITLPGVERHFESTWFDGFDASGYDAAYLCGYEYDGAGGWVLLEFLEANPHLQVFFAPGPVICKLGQDKIDRINALHPVWHLNAVEANDFTGIADIESAGQTLVKACGNVVIITEGAKGSHVFVPVNDQESVAHELVPTHPVKPLDTIGAGDSHIGAVMAAWANGCLWAEAAAQANRVSAGVCQVAGATLTDEEFAALVLER